MTATLTQVSGPAYTRILSYGAARGAQAFRAEDLTGHVDEREGCVRRRTGVVTRVRAGRGTDAIERAG
ncbi:3-oxoacyl-ACP synthase, partial [Pseudomonas sp. BGM005]|nr:3-oxoacyl-ACP synthase [Pseudomonas sp. BG5]